MVHFSPIVGLLLASLVPAAYSQLTPDQAQIRLVGTWSSGSQHVVTGPDFSNPANMSFNYPKTTGISYSFTADNFYELARYRMNSNGSEPTCITAVIGWSHGTYQLNPNGSMTLTPFRDGYQQIQDPCAAVSENFIEDYRVAQEFYQNWMIFVDATAGPKLHMFQFDGAPLAPMFLHSETPIMHPTRLLRNVTNPDDQAANSTLQRRSESGTVNVRWSSGLAGISSIVALAFASLTL